MPKKFKYIMCFLFVILIFFCQCCFAEKTAPEKIAFLVNLKGAISPASYDYINRNLTNAIRNKAEFLILRLDTPGGLEASMREIDKAILASPIPFITYVAPEGARAASAGTFILYASHIAVMAPGTNVGAASPVTIGEGLLSEKTKSPNEATETKKSMNDAAAYIRSLAELRGRNAEWGVKAVTQAVSISAEEAAKLKVINFIAKDTAELLQKLQGYSVKIDQETKILQTSDVKLQEVNPDWRFQFLSIITDPNIAYILFLIGIYGLFFELYNPGFVLPGVAGAIALLLALYAFQLLPVSYTGFALTLLGIIFMVIEVFVGSFGVLGMAGVIAFIVGSIFLLDINNPEYNVAWQLILMMSLVTAGFFLVVINLVLRSRRAKIVSGKEALIGKEGIVLERSNSHLTVRVAGEIWQASSSSEIKPGQEIKVTAIRDLHLSVEPIDKKGV